MKNSPSGITEINFDGIIGPSHNYAGLSHGNIASASHGGQTSFPREAALQGIAKMRHNLKLGLAQGFFLPLPRPNRGWLAQLGSDVSGAEPHLRAAAFSASAMWAANAATVSPAPDTIDGKCHLIAANLLTMAHRSHEHPDTLRQLQLAFSDRSHFAVHAALPPPFGDEGAANHMRLCPEHGSPGIEIFIYGAGGGPFPARQHVEASKAAARINRVDPDRVILAQQSATAIATGAFHNDVVAVANEHVLFAHEHAFADLDLLFETIHRKLPTAEIIVVPADAVSLSDAIQSYLFNAQLVTLPGDEGMALILPTEAQGNERVWRYLTELVAGNGPIRQLLPVDVRQSMANGGGPACLRLRVVADPQTVDPRFIATSEKLDAIAELVTAHWPEAVSPSDLADPAFAESVIAARTALLRLCDLAELDSALSG